jgi:hypothetical protein
MTFCEAELMLLLLFLKRRKYQFDWFLEGKPANHQGRLRRDLGSRVTFCEAELMLLLLFLKRRKY